MLQKVIVLVCFSLLAILVQLLFVPWMTIRNIRPDFILLLVLIVGRLKGRIVGQLYGFSIGLLIDAIGMGSFLGLSALTKTISGFFSGYLKNQKGRLNLFSYYAIAIIIIFAHFVIFYLVNFKGAEFTTYHIILRYVIPASIYTSVFYILIDHFLPLGSE